MQTTTSLLGRTTKTLQNARSRRKGSSRNNISNIESNPCYQQNSSQQEQPGKHLQQQAEEDRTTAQEREERSPPRAGRTQGVWKVSTKFKVQK
jgi:hypothetical protein